MAASGKQFKKIAKCLAAGDHIGSPSFGTNREIKSAPNWSPNQESGDKQMDGKRQPATEGYELQLLVCCLPIIGSESQTNSNNCEWLRLLEAKQASASASANYLGPTNAYPLALPLASSLYRRRRRRSSWSSILALVIVLWLLLLLATTWCRDKTSQQQEQRRRQQIDAQVTSSDLAKCGRIIGSLHLGPYMEFRHVDTLTTCASSSVTDNNYINNNGTYNNYKSCSTFYSSLESGHFWRVGAELHNEFHNEFDLHWICRDATKTQTRNYTHVNVFRLSQTADRYQMTTTSAATRIGSKVEPQKRDCDTKSSQAQAKIIQAKYLEASVCGQCATLLATNEMAVEPKANTFQDVQFFGSWILQLTQSLLPASISWRSFWASFERSNLISVAEASAVLSSYKVGKNWKLEAAKQRIRRLSNAKIDTISNPSDGIDSFQTKHQRHIKSSSTQVNQNRDQTLDHFEALANERPATESKRNEQSVDHYGGDDCERDYADHQDADALANDDDEHSDGDYSDANDRLEWTARNDLAKRQTNEAYKSRSAESKPLGADETDQFEAPNNNTTRELASSVNSMLELDDNERDLSSQLEPAKVAQHERIWRPTRASNGQDLSAASLLLGWQPQAGSSSSSSSSSSDESELNGSSGAKWIETEGVNYTNGGQTGKKARANSLDWPQYKPTNGAATEANSISDSSSSSSSSSSSDGNSSNNNNHAADDQLPEVNKEIEYFGPVNSAVASTSVLDANAYRARSTSKSYNDNQISGTGKCFASAFMPFVPPTSRQAPTKLEIAPTKQPAPTTTTSHDANWFNYWNELRKKFATASVNLYCQIQLNRHDDSMDELICCEQTPQTPNGSATSAHKSPERKYPGELAITHIRTYAHYNSEPTNPIAGYIESCLHSSRLTKRPT